MPMSIREREQGGVPGKTEGKNKASLARSIQKLFFAARTEKKWRYDDALLYALCMRKDKPSTEPLTENQFLPSRIPSKSCGPDLRYFRIINLFTRNILDAGIE